MKSILLLMVAFLFGCASAEGQCINGTCPAPTTTESFAVCGSMSGSNSRQRLGNRLHVSVGLLNLVQATKDTEGDVGQSATVGRQKNRTRTRTRLFFRRIRR